MRTIRSVNDRSAEKNKDGQSGKPDCFSILFAEYNIHTRKAAHGRKDSFLRLRDKIYFLFSDIFPFCFCFGR